MLRLQNLNDGAQVLRSNDSKMILLVDGQPLAAIVGEILFVVEFKYANDKTQTTLKIIENFAETYHWAFKTRLTSARAISALTIGL